MIRLLIFLTIISCTTNKPKSRTFDGAVKRLYFDVDIFNASASILDDFLSIENLHYNDTVTRNWNLNASIGRNHDKETWFATHKFSFSKSPLAGTTIKSGQIKVTVLERGKENKLFDVGWQVNFDNKKDAENFYEKLQEIFSPVSKQHKIEYGRPLGELIQFSSLNENEKGIQGITILYGESLETKDYQILLSLPDKFKFKEELREE